jgi:hypothetical protein
MPPRVVARPSARRARPTSSLSTGLPTISPAANTSPVVSTMVIIITMTIETTAATLKVGAPKWNGVVTPTTSAPETRLKSVKSKTQPARVPISSPRSTAMVATKPLNAR